MDSKGLSFNFGQPETWPSYLEELTVWFDARGVTTAAQKRGLLHASICEETKRRLKEWVHPRTIVLVDYDELIQIISDNIRPSVNKAAMFKSLVCRFQKETETGAQFMSALHTLAAHLGFGWHTSQLVLYQFKRGLLDKNLQEKLYSDSALDSTEALDLVTAGEVSKQCVQNLQPAEEVNALSYRQQSSTNRNQQQKQQNRNQNQQQRGQSQQQPSS